MSAKLTIAIPDWLDKICVWPVMMYRRCKFGYSFRKIKLEEREWTIVEQEDYYRLSKYNWHLNDNGATKIYAARSIRIGPGKLKTVRMHREIMDFPEGMLVDHKNGDTLDNRRSNLRLATHAQNARNSRKKENTSSKYFGLTFDWKRNKWAVRITFQNKSIWLGKYDNEIEAARVYDEAAKKYFGEFAHLNFPEPQITQISQNKKRSLEFRIQNNKL